MHTFFVLENMSGLKTGKIYGEICLNLDKSEIQAAKLKRDKITNEEYDQWRYKYSELDTCPHWTKVPSQTIIDIFLEKCIKKKRKKRDARRKKVQ